jgi:hypothetical protein
MKTYTGSNNEVTIEYTVTSNYTDDLVTTSFSKVVDFLLEDDTLFQLVKADYTDASDTSFDEDDLRAYVYEHADVLAQEFGYTILTNLK